MDSKNPICQPNPSEACPLLSDSIRGRLRSVRASTSVPAMSFETSPKTEPTTPVEQEVTESEVDEPLHLQAIFDEEGTCKGFGFVNQIKY
jgi:hypothetical protein